MLIAAIALAALCATYAGGLFALRLKDRLHLVLGFSAGAVVGVAFFDLIPEALALAGSSSTPTAIVSCVAAGFLSYLVLDRVQMLRAVSEGESDELALPTTRRGALGAASLSAHSVLDGVAVGLALQASIAVGAVVAIAVVAHDFSDGINTTNIVLKNGGSQRQALRWLLADALAPVVGIGLTLFVRIPNAALAIVLAVFGGFFLYIGASDLIPESYHGHPKLWTTVMTLLGAAGIFFAVLLARQLGV